MDTLTHGLLGAVIAVLPLPRALLPRGESTRAALVACVIAAELPDLDYLVPAGDAVLHTLKAHRGVTHALIAAPVVALVAALIAKLIFRSAQLGPIYLRALIAVPIAHLLPDLWTGWGTRLFLPFSDQRAALDWTMVIDPYFTLPLLLAACFRRRSVLLIGAAAATLYLGLRIALSVYLSAQVADVHPTARAVHVFPAPLAVLRWRYIAEVDGHYAAGEVTLGESPIEQARVSREIPTMPDVETVREAMAWARFPVVRVIERQIEVADLRYHLRGEPTLKFVIVLDASDAVIEARLDRGGSARELFQRWRSR